MMKVTLGPQKKSRVVSDTEKFNTAVHESGHAIIHKLAKEPSPVQEVSIIPRGGAGGYTLSADDDRLYFYRESLYCKIQALLGGIVAEKLFVGDSSTGASSDLKRATNIARKMVTEWGMSDEIGMVYSGSDGDIFVGKNYQERMSYSENQAARIDAEIKKIIDACEKEVEKLLKNNKDKLLTMANVLVEKETIYAEEVDLILNGKTKEEIIAYIENKDNKEKGVSKSQEEINDVSKEKSEKNFNENQVENNDKIDKNKSQFNSPDELLIIAEKREKEQSLKNESPSQELKENEEKEAKKRTPAKTLTRKTSSKGEGSVEKKTSKNSTKKEEKIDE